MRTLITAILVLFVLALLAPPAAPVQISYVVSDSMEPTISTGDGYVLVPANDVRAGDIITYYSAGRDAFVTHRAVRVTRAGIVTKGDANPSTDQAAGYPLVQPGEVTGTVLTVRSTPLLIPHLGDALGLIEQYWYAVIGAGLLYPVVGGDGSRRTNRREAPLRGLDIIVPVVLLAIVAGSVLVTMGAVEDTQTYAVVDGGTVDATTLTVGEPRTETRTVRLVHSPLTYVMTETTGMRVTDERRIDVPAASSGSTSATAAWLAAVGPKTTVHEVTTTILPPDDTGSHRTTFGVYTYPATLPTGVIDTLHGLHPLVATVVTTTAGLVPAVFVYGLLVDPLLPLRPSPRRPTHSQRGREP